MPFSSILKEINFRMETTKTKILNIETGKAQKNVKTLRQQIKELKDEMALLEQGTVEYDKASQKLANLSQKQIEINEAMKYSNKDLGQTLSNLTSVASGVVGAISSINGVMVLMGADSEEAMEAMKRIQALMAIIQGLGAIDTAVKALKGLTVAFQGFNDVRVKTITTSVGASGAELAEAGALGENTKEMVLNNKEAKEFNKLNKEGVDATEKSTNAILAEKEALKGNTEAANEYLRKLNELQTKRAAQVNVAKDLSKDNLISHYQDLIKIDKESLQINQQLGKNNPQFVENLKKNIAEYEKTIQGLKDGTIDAFQYIENAWALASSDFSQYFGTNKAEEIKKQMEGIAAAMSPEQIEIELKDLNEELTDITNAYLEKLGNGEQVIKEFYQEDKKDIEEQIAILEKAKEAKINQTYQEEFYKKKIIETTQAENAETGAINANTIAKEANADATGDVADAEKKLGTETKKNEPILRKAWKGITNGIKNAGKALGAFVKANPILSSIIGAVVIIGAGIAYIASAFKDAHKEAYELKKMNIELDMEFKKQKTDMEALIRMFNQENLTAKEKETLAKEINKLAGDELVARNKITGEWEIQIEKMQEYQRNLRTQIELEYHKKAILEAMDKEEEARQDANYERNHLIGNLLRTEEGYLEDASEAVAEQEKHWKAIEKLTSNVVENIDKENKKLDKTTNGGGIRKTFADLSKELKALWKEFYAQLTKEKEIERTFDGVYSKALIAYDKALEAINGSMLGDKISKDFVKAFEKGLKGIKSNEITLDMIFVDRKELDKQLDDAKNILRNLFNEGKKVTDKQVQDAKKRIDVLKEEISNYEAIAKSVYDYKKALEDLEKTRKETNDANALYNKQQDINLNYKPKIRREQGRDFQYEETNKEIEQQRLLYQTTMKRLTEEKARLDELKQSNLENKATIEEIAELEKKINEDQKAANEAQMQMDELRYQNRLTKLQEEYARIEINSELEQQWYEIEQSIKGGGVADYNIDVDLLEMELEAIVEKANMVDEYYEKLQEQHDENSQEWYVLEEERLAAQEALQRQYMNKDIELEQEKSKRKLNIQKSYIAAYQNISSQVSNVLGTLMNEYDENSKEYLSLKYAQGVTDTLSGTLAAYMSGIESGLPAPWNTVLAATMASMTFATGVAQLRNIKSNSLSNAATANTVEIGNEYDTLSYAQNAEILSNIQDSRVIVVESDITSTQRRVQVSESAAMF